MALQIQNLSVDVANKRAILTLSDPTTYDQVQANFPMSFTGNETLTQAGAMAKARAKQIFQAAVALL
jgi:hypothetical protein